MAAGHILIVEDDRNIAKLVSYNLEKTGYKCTVTSTGEEAFAVLCKEQMNLMLLDIMLPGMDGFEVCKRLKKDSRFSNMPVIMLTAKGEETDRVVGFELGAADYVVKPFSMRELMLRIKSILQREKAQAESGDILTVGKLVVDPMNYKVSINNEDIILTHMEFKLLVILVKRRGCVQSREQLLEEVWDISSEIMTRTIDTHIKRLRDKLGEFGKMIETVRSVGYRFRED
jgi:DNA-binding response OmpR family regulator